MTLGDLSVSINLLMALSLIAAASVAYTCWRRLLAGAVIIAEILSLLAGSACRHAPSPAPGVWAANWRIRLADGCVRLSHHLWTLRDRHLRQTGQGGDNQ